MAKTNLLRWFALLLAVVGAANWALVGLFNFDLIHEFVGSVSVIRDVFYVLIAISTLAMLRYLPKKQITKLGKN